MYYRIFNNIAKIDHLKAINKWNIWLINNAHLKVLLRYEFRSRTVLLNLCFCKFLPSVRRHAACLLSALSCPVTGRVTPAAAGALWPVSCTPKGHSAVTGLPPPLRTAGIRGVISAMRAAYHNRSFCDHLVRLNKYIPIRILGSYRVWHTRASTQQTK